MDVIIKRVHYMWFKSLWQTFEALVGKMCIEGKCMYFPGNILSNYLKKIKVMGPTTTYKGFIYLFIIIYSNLVR